MSYNETIKMPLISEGVQQLKEHIGSSLLTIIFGIHSVSGEGERIREREEPKKTSKNRITWSSITRMHEIAFYDENLRPAEVVIGEYGHDE
jgi:hypothetical protein